MEQKKEHTRLTLEEEFDLHKKLKVVFIKKDGSKRTMICSRHTDLLPESKQVAEGQEKTTSKPPSETNFRIFDLENQQWKQFTIANLLSIEPYDYRDEERTDSNGNLLEG
jgi:hypothetical protein